MNGKIMWDADAPAGAYGLIREVDGTGSILIQSDWDLPSIALAFGATLNYLVDNGCAHLGTDGTVRCVQCGADPGDFIGAALRWLDGCDGEIVDDVMGYSFDDVGGQP